LPINFIHSTSSIPKIFLHEYTISYSELYNIRCRKNDLPSHHINNFLLAHNASTSSENQSHSIVVTPSATNAFYVLSIPKPIQAMSRPSSRSAPLATLSFGGTPEPIRPLSSLKENVVLSNLISRYSLKVPEDRTAPLFS
jgi:hypothetical protein